MQVIGRETGLNHVEFQGRQFTVFMACVDSGWEYRVNGKWRDETDPLIAERIHKDKRRPNYQSLCPNLCN